MSGRVGACLAATMVVAGCSTTLSKSVQGSADVLQVRAAFEMQCPAKDLKFHILQSTKLNKVPLVVGVEGCGRRATYIRVQNDIWSLNYDLPVRPGVKPWLGTAVKARAPEREKATFEFGTRDQVNDAIGRLKGFVRGRIVCLTKANRRFRGTLSEVSDSGDLVITDASGEATKLDGNTELVQCAAEAPQRGQK